MRRPELLELLFRDAQVVLGHERILLLAHKRLHPHLCLERLGLRARQRRACLGALVLRRAQRQLQLLDPRRHRLAFGLTGGHGLVALPGPVERCLECRLVLRLSCITCRGGLRLGLLERLLRRLRFCARLLELALEVGVLLFGRCCGGLTKRASRVGRALELCDQRVLLLERFGLLAHLGHSLLLGGLQLGGCLGLDCLDGLGMCFVLGTQRCLVLCCRVVGGLLERLPGRRGWRRLLGLLGRRVQA